jgi:hypothetical protein
MFEKGSVRIFAYASGDRCETIGTGHTSVRPAFQGGRAQFALARLSHVGRFLARYASKGGVPPLHPPQSSENRGPEFKRNEDDRDASTPPTTILENRRRRNGGRGGRRCGTQNDSGWRRRATSPTQHTRRPRGVPAVRGFARISSVGRIGPFPDVAVHVIQAQGVVIVGANWRRPAKVRACWCAAVGMAPVEIRLSRGQ